MGKARYLIVSALLALAMPATTVASVPQIYVGSNPAYIVAFKAEGSRVSVLALNAPVYCSFGDPVERFPATMFMFQAPTLMHAGRNGLEARLRPAGGPRSYVSASLGGGKMTGTFVYDVTEESAHCQAVGFTAAKPRVRFEAVRYEPAGSGATLPANKDEIPIYYGDEGGVEVLFETLRGSVDFRGAAPAACPVAGKRPAGRRAPLFDDIEDARLEAGNSFGRVFHRKGAIGDGSWSEATSISGALKGGTMSGTYGRSTVTRPAQGPPQQCKTGPLAFSAARYLPALP